MAQPLLTVNGKTYTEEELKRLVELVTMWVLEPTVKVYEKCWGEMSTLVGVRYKGGLMAKDYGEPWEVVYEERWDWSEITDHTTKKVVRKIVDRDGSTVIETDAGAYPPDIEIANRIVQLVNENAGR